MSRGRAGHHHFVDAAEGHDGGLNSDDGVGIDRFGFVHQPLQGQVTRVVEDVAELLDLASGQALQSPDDAAAHADRISDVAKHKLERLEARVELAIEFLAVAAGREVEFAGRRIGPVDAGADRQELDVAMKGFEVAGDAGDPVPAMLGPLRPSACGAKACSRPS